MIATQEPQPTSDAAQLHSSVMLSECLELFAPVAQRPGAVIIDATLGLGGHTEALLNAHSTLTVIGLDRDREALALATQRLQRFGHRFIGVHTVYDQIDDAVQSAGFSEIDGVLFDLGVSSMQLDSVERGFAYAQDAPLDMRMDQSQGISASEIIASASEGTLRAIFERYGDEPLAGRYARAIIAAREETPILRSGQLVDILQQATPAAVRDQRHPAKRVFQALRVEVNAELQALEGALPAALDLLNMGGRAVVLSYQSHEDRFVKRVFADRCSSHTPPGLPVELAEYAAQFRLIVRGAQMASDEERAHNPRAIPVRLRAVERVRVGQS